MGLLPSLPCATGSLLSLLALGGTSCRAFPVGLYVPDAVLEALASPRYAEDLDESALARALERRAGTPVRARDTSDARAGFWRLDLAPVLGPLAARAFAACTSPAARGLASGDLVLIKNPKAQSLATTLAFAEFTYYDHLAVLVEREGRYLVCDSWPSFHPLGKSEDFAARFRGGVRATPLAEFIEPYESLLFVRLADAAGAARLGQAALDSLDEGIEYDPHHDQADPRLSCSEYVLMLLERAGLAGPSEPRTVSSAPELRALLLALGFPSTGFVVPDQFAALPGARAIAWISRHPTRAAACASEAAFAVLHERSRAGDRVADFLGIDRFRFLRYRANVRQFLRWSAGWAEARGLEQRAQLVPELRALAPLFFRAEP